MIPAEIIRKKRDGVDLQTSEIEAFFSGIGSDGVADYQASAMLMAIFLNGLNMEETATLTKTMLESGERLRWTSPGNIVDKHSTGGVGDKTSLILLPLCALEGLRVPMMSGRGLGHSGGTLDKLESIPGTQVRLSKDKAQALVEKHGGAFLGQSEEFAPLDRRLYSLRDVTATVESVPLITASILSKKLAEGLDGLVMDVKFGSGAFMKTLEEALDLANSLKNVAKIMDLPTTCLLTSMNSPLGRTAGNQLEIIECVEVLQGGGPKDTRELSLELAKEMVVIQDPDTDQQALRKRLEDHLSSGRAFQLFCEIIADQGGDRRFLDDVKEFREAPHQFDIKAPKSGYVQEIDVRALGMAVVELGGGRKKLSDKIDPCVGLSHLTRLGESVDANEPIARVHCRQSELPPALKESIISAFRIGDERVEFDLIAKRISSRET